MCVCMSIWVHVYVYFCMLVILFLLYVCLYVLLHMCLYVHICLCACVFMQMCMSRVKIVMSDENTRQNLSYIKFTSELCQIKIAKLRTCGFRTFFEPLMFFLWRYEGFCLYFHRLHIYITSCYLVVSCVYIPNSVVFTSLLMLGYLLTSFEARLCIWWFLGNLLG